MNDAQIKENIRRIRKKRNLTQEELAGKLGISTKAYQDIENGPTAILSNRLSLIAEALGTPVEVLVLGGLPNEESHALEQLESSFETKYAELEQERDYWKHLAEEKGKRIAEMEERLRDKDTIIKLLQNKKPF